MSSAHRGWSSPDTLRQLLVLRRQSLAPTLPHRAVLASSLVAKKQLFRDFEILVLTLSRPVRTAVCQSRLLSVLSRRLHIWTGRRCRLRLAACLPPCSIWLRHHGCRFRSPLLNPMHLGRPHVCRCMYRSWLKRVGCHQWHRNGLLWLLPLTLSRVIVDCAVLAVPAVIAHAPHGLHLLTCRFHAMCRAWLSVNLWRC